jgi:hypothetical protein
MEHWQNIINIVGGALLAGIGWFCREIWDSVKSLREDVHRIEINLPESYIKRSEIEARLDKIDMRFEKLDANIAKLFERLDNR